MNRRAGCSWSQQLASPPGSTVIVRDRGRLKDAASSCRVLDAPGFVDSTLCPIPPFQLTSQENIDAQGST